MLNDQSPINLLTLDGSSHPSCLWTCYYFHRKSSWPLPVDLLSLGWGFYYMTIEFGWTTAYTLLRWYIAVCDIFINSVGNTVLLLWNTIVIVKHSLNSIMNIYKPAILVVDWLGCLLQLIPNSTPWKMPNYKEKYKKGSIKSRGDVFWFRQRCKGLNHCGSGTHSRYHNNNYTKSYYQGSRSSQRPQ